MPNQIFSISVPRYSYKEKDSTRGSIECLGCLKNRIKNSQLAQKLKKSCQKGLRIINLKVKKKCNMSYEQHLFHWEG